MQLCINNNLKIDKIKKNIMHNCIICYILKSKLAF